MRLRAIEPSETTAFDRALAAAFHDELSDEDAALFAQVSAPERQLVWDDGGRIVATCATFARELTVPGGTVTAAAVTAAGVQPTHRRRGLLTALMRRQLDDVHERWREPVAILWASEAAIYPRFGFGLATWAGALRVDRAAAKLRPELAVAAGPAEAPAPDDALPALRARHDRVRRQRPGMLDRAGGWWAVRLHHPRRTAGSGPLRAALVEDGYALYAVRTTPEAGREAVVRELVAATAPAAAALWTYLLGLDLVRTVRWEHAPPDEPLGAMLVAADAVAVALEPALWVRLVDVGAALAARRLDAPADVVVEVRDAFCPWNEARFALDGSRTAARADLALDVDALGSAYLGGTSVAALAAAGRVEERTPGAAATATRALAAPRAPWCPEPF
jgi:predicted acetyltransferase